MAKVAPNLFCKDKLKYRFFLQKEISNASNFVTLEDILKCLMMMTSITNNSGQNPEKKNINHCTSVTTVYQTAYSSW